MSLAEAIAAAMHDGDTVAMEGFTHLIPYAAGASGLPFAILRGYRGTSLPSQTAGVAEVTCPFTGETLTAVSALRPDVAVIHAQRADPLGNVQYWGITGVQKECVLAAARSVVTVEEIVDELDPRPGAVVLPSWAVTYIAAVPGGAHPSYALGYSARDNDFYMAWDAISRDRALFGAWLDEHVYRAGGAAPVANTVLAGDTRSAR